MTVLGIIGRPLGHSLSKAWFEEKFATAGLYDWQFEKFQLDNIGELAEVLERHGDKMKGFCVTKPYKKEVMAWLDEISPEALAIGAVNCVRVACESSNPDGKLRLTGYNTDAHGFRIGLERLLDGTKPRALVLGTGGASCAVRWVLENAGIEYRMVSRDGGPGLLSYTELTPGIIDGHRLIVNTTPLGMFPNVDEKPPIPYTEIGPEHYLYDLVYNPPVTAFLAEGERRGALTMNGETMFREQAEKNWDIWRS